MSNFGAPELQQVYHGAWTDWSRGKVLGATLTMSQRNANLLIAFVALFVAFAGTCFFRIVCFALYRAFSTNSPQDGIYHQRQAILRNAASGLASLNQLVYILWRWRRQRRGILRRLLPLSAYITLTVLGFTVAGIFSSRISIMAGGGVLISSPFCGYLWQPENATAADITELYAKYVSLATSWSMNYAQSCYSNPSNEEVTSKGVCGLFVKPRLPLKVSFNATCPFDNQTCLTTDKNIMVDTGYLNSHTDLGFNAPESKQVLFRRVLHCGPIVTEGYTNTFIGRDNRSYQAYDYGPRVTAAGGNLSLYTYVDSLDSFAQKNADLVNVTNTNPDYGLRLLLARSFNGSILPSQTTFFPIPELSRTDADVNLIFLSASGIGYLGEVNDDWYAAHTLAIPHLKLTNTAKSNTSVYVADNPASVLGCAEQVQTCVRSLPAREQCSSLGGLQDTILPLPGESSEQYSNRQWVTNAMLTFSIEPMLQSLGPFALASRGSIYQGYQPVLPNNQWQLDVERWQNIILATMQGSAVATATGPSDPDLQARFLMRPANAEEKYNCKNQKIRTSTHANVSIFGLSFTLVLGSIIIILSYTLQPLVDWIRKHRHRSQYSRLEWSINGVLQLQRLAHEELGLGIWTHCDADVPVTAPQDRFLAVLDMEDPKHPMLKVPESLMSEDVTGMAQEDEEPKPTVVATEAIDSPVDDRRSVGHVPTQNSRAENVVGDDTFGEGVNNAVDDWRQWNRELRLDL